MLRISKLTDYGVLLLTHLAAEPDQLVTSHEVAERTHIPEPTAAKLLKLLTRSGLLESVRGAKGGYRMATPADSITVLQIVTALEGPVSLTECGTDDSGCAIEGCCETRPNWQRISEVVNSALARVTLADMRQPSNAVQTVSLDVLRSAARA